MNDKWLKAFPAAMKYAAGAGAVTYILMFVAVALIRMGYPYELECLEGMGVDHVQRILDGKPLYVAPSVDFVPSIYTPFYYYVSAVPAAIFGNGPMPLRLVSFLASLGCMLLIYSYARRESQSRYAALIAAGLFAATYYVSAAWFDLARVDMLFVCLLLMAAWLVRFRGTRAGFIAAGLLTTAAFLTKQTALLAAIFFVVYGLKMRKEKGWYLVLSTTLGIGLSVMILDRVHDGWFSFYTLRVPAGHLLEPLAFIKLVPQDIFRPLPVAALFSVLFLILRGLRGAKNDVWFYVLIGMGFLACAAAPRVKEGNAVNDMIPVFAFVALLFGAAIPTVRAWGSEVFGYMPPDYPERTRLRLWLSVFFYGLIVVQLSTLFYGPQNVIPTAADRAAGDALVREVANYRGDVWVTHHGYITTLAGKHPHAMDQPILDMLYADNPLASALFNEDLEHALRECRFAAIVSDNCDFLHMGYRKDYAGEPLRYGGPDDFWPVTGYRTRPEIVYVPQDARLAVGTAP